MAPSFGIEGSKMADIGNNSVNSTPSTVVLGSVAASGPSDVTSTQALVNNQHIRMLRKITDFDAVKESRTECPQVNCPEKIIICLDVSQEMEKVSFRSRAGDKFAPSKLARRALGMFLHTKHRIDHRHQFSLVVLHETAQWVHNFTYNPNDILSFLEDLNESYPNESCDIGSLFEVVNQNIGLLPRVEDPTVIPPQYVVRVILLYGRSYCIPKFEKTEAMRLLQASPYFFLDAYYIHEPPSEENQCEPIFDVICDLDVKGLSYVFEVSRNPTKVYDCMSQLLAHPLQRPLQKDASYDVEPPQAAEVRVP